MIKVLNYILILMKALKRNKKICLLWKNLMKMTNLKNKKSIIVKKIIKTIFNAINTDNNI